MTSSPSGDERPSRKRRVSAPLLYALLLPLTLGLTGCWDLLFPPEGACVTSYGSCLEDFMEDSCSSPGDTWYEGESCDDVEGGGGGACDDYTDGYDSGDHAQYYCQAAWNAQCYDDEQTRAANCAILLDFAGSTAECPYCD